ncbi:enoyl-CoA hydratase/carnithine racemase [Spongiibacter sp. IMCC21906]|uniref:enoyl-CoA hydratase-related protein n=1 Tax=Spongiibacter sp. IMCC21906 TaxID=1620392 RepID=UPI00062DF4A8|nr:enoyl-CoA hydratase-related protein [Spongiibacter sp. IMCC21906]AKH70439.1 enoyl-CoA hydratase/carnithine racemase [Spongiibacter sp. IMCC21906]
MLEQPSLQDATLTHRNGYAICEFQRDDVRNALTGTALIEDICAVLDWANSDIRIACVIFTGQGSAFSSGGNIKEMAEQRGMFGGSPAEISEAYRKGIQRMSRAVFNAEVVTIAAVNGAAVGAGFDMCCMCDLRIGCEATRFGETFVNLGIIPGDGGAWFLQRLVGYQRAAELTFSGRIIDSQEARNLGLLLECVDKDQLLATAENYAASYASKPPLALRQSKRLMRVAQRQELDDFLDLCADVQAQCHHTQDHQRALHAFLNKEPAHFKGD